MLIDISIHAPAKGATRCDSSLLRLACISIHAPAKGATRSDQARDPPYKNFNPRSREGSDNYANICLGDNYDFNPRSREGSDMYVVAVSIEQAHFNPRSREGSDLRPKPAKVCAPTFQSTLPRRERRYAVWADYVRKLISIHAPAKGATRCDGSCTAQSSKFQSTLPRRERRAEVQRCAQAAGFQSTLPRRERPVRQGRYYNATRFQSTLPRRERPCL